MTFLKTILSLFLFVPSLANTQNKAKPFLPSLFSTLPNVRDIAISPDNQSIYFTIDSYKSEIGSIAYINKLENGWSDPKIVSFSGRYRDLEPAFSSDGKTLYFASNRPRNKDSIAPKNYDIWFVTKLNNGWSSPKNLGSSVNTEHNEFFPSIAKNGTLYFTSDRPSEVGRENIYMCRFKNGAFMDPTPLGENINSKYYEFNAFVAPDESYLLFSAIRPNEGVGGGDLYISFNKNGWQKAQLLRFVNTPFLDFCPYVDAKSGKLYFTSQKSEIPPYSQTPVSIDFYLNLPSSEMPKGLNRLYSIDLDNVLPK